MVLEVCDRDGDLDLSDTTTINDRKDHIIHATTIDAPSILSTSAETSPAKNDSICAHHIAEKPSFGCDLSQSSASSCNSIDDKIASNVKKQETRRTESTRNTVLVGKATSQMKRGEVGPTSFSMLDLHLPGDMRKKARKPLNKRI
jgi:hypothetical protein